ncbi:MAG: hypothetical protein R3240_06610, partial [Gammaproteobacteria bacterium]|nr:hypothetical protein [Gammaproteobacteria bacterium]
KLLKDTLANMPAPAMPDNLEADILARLEEKPVSQTRGFIAGFSSAAAAALAAWLVFSPAQIPVTAPTPAYETLSSLNISQNSVNKVKLAFNAPDDFQQVTLTLRLPEGTELDGFPGQQELSWKTSLKTGQNILTLPLITHSNNGGILEAKISSSTRSKIIKLNMNVSKPNNSAIKI